MKNDQKGFIVPLVIIAVALVALSGGLYIYKNVATPTTSGEVSEEVSASQQQNTPVSGGAKKTLRELLLSKTPASCEDRSKENGITTVNAAYFVQGKMRFDVYELDSSGNKKSGIQMIFNDADMYQYVWVEGLFGYKIKKDPGETDIASRLPEGFPSDFEKDIDDPMWASCVVWTEDPSLFVPPSNVNFQLQDIE